MGSVELALRDVQPHAPIRPLLHNIQVAGKHAADLTGQMLAYSGKGGFVVEEVDINSMIRDMSSLLASSTSKMVRLSYELSEDLPGVKADATQLRQVVLNLVGNASDAASGQTGEVHVATGVTNCDRTLLDGLSPNRAIPSGRYVTLRVRDMGCGMDPDTRAKVFDPFFTTKSTGRGLGLAAVHGIVTGHEGAIEVESEPGQGTSFKVLLPALDRPAVGLVATAEPSVTWRGSGIVLVVDDEAMVRKVAAHMLKRVGFSSVLASDGVEAVERFRECSKEITAVLLDLNMPRMDGEETLAELRKIEGSVPVVLCSGYDERESTGRFGGRGLAGFLEKPYDLAALREALRKALDSPTVIA